MIIYFYQGAYGTFIEWCLNYFTDINYPDNLPFLSNGSSHAFWGNVIISNKQFKTLVQSNDWAKFQRIHPQVIDNNIEVELQTIQQYIDKVVFLYYDTDHAYWGFDNELTKNMKSDYYSDNKILKKELIEKEAGENVLQWVDALEANSDYEHVSILYEKYIDKKNIKRWGKNNIRDLEKWEVRELFSYYFNDIIEEKCSKTLFDDLKEKFPNIKFVEISTLLNNFQMIIIDLIKYCNLTLVREADIDKVYHSWLPLQTHRNKDQLIKDIVNATINKEYLEWQDLTIFDEAEIQRLLRVNGLNFNCYGVNTFPKNSIDLNNYVE